MVTRKVYRQPLAVLQSEGMPRKLNLGADAPRLSGEPEAQAASQAPAHSEPLLGAATYFGAMADVIDALPDAIALLSYDWRVLYANQTSRRVSRITEDNLKHDTLWEMYPDMGETLNTAYREAMESREPRLVKGFYYPPFRTWYDIHMLPAPCGLALLYQDTTAVREAETHRDAAVAQLEAALNTTSDGVTSVDREWRVTYMNPRALEHVAPTGNPVGHNLWERFPAAFYEGSPYVEHYYRAMDERIAGEFEAYYPEPIDSWYRISVKPAPSGIIFFAQEITEQKRAQAALIQSEKLAAVGRLASSIAHEINNPLEAVTNLLYLARTQVQDEAIRGYLDLAEEELRRVSIIANQTLRFHKQATRPQEIQCHDLFTNVLSMYEGKLRNANIQLEKRKRAHRGVLCMEGEIRQVLANFVGNAIDAMPLGGRLHIRSREATDWRTGRQGLVLTVADTGAGIDPETLPRIFEAFFTTKGLAGTGLGLWVSAEIVERHGGRILIRSSQSPTHHGTVVGLFLPFSPTAQLRAY